MFMSCWFILWLVTIVASVRIGLIARRLGWRIGIALGWIVPEVVFLSTLLSYYLSDAYGDSSYYYGRAIIWPTAIALTVGAGLIWAKVGRQAR